MDQLHKLFVCHICTHTEYNCDNTILHCSIANSNNIHEVTSQNSELHILLQLGAADHAGEVVSHGS